MRNKKIRIVIDCTMAVLLPMLMAYSLVGETFHEIAGTLMFLLFIVHNLMNLGFWKGLFRGKYNAQRSFRTILNVLLLIMMIIQPLSGIAMSKHLYVFLPSIGISATARQIHLLFAYWGFILMSIHAGTHADMMFAGLNKQRHKVSIVAKVILCLISVYGIWAFIRRDIASYMFMKTQFVFFNFNEPRIMFFLDYIAIMIMSGTVGSIIISLLKRFDQRFQK